MVLQTYTTIPKLAVIGVGLIAGSMVKAMKNRNLCAQVIGYDQNPDELAQALSCRVIDQIAASPLDAVRDANFVVIGVPVGAIASVFSSIVAELEFGTVITDVGSVKSCVVQSAAEIFGRHYPNFIPGHPIAGSEKNGVSAANPDLFQNHRVLLTPTAQTNPVSLQMVQSIWEALGAVVEQMDAETHDKVLAATSHLPHLLAYTLVNTISEIDPTQRLLNYAAGGFADTTRVASSSPDMWKDITITNRDALLEVLSRFESELAALKQAVYAKDSQMIVDYFRKAKAIRDEFTVRRANLTL